VQLVSSIERPKAAQVQLVSIIKNHEHHHPSIMADPERDACVIIVIVTTQPLWKRGTLCLPYIDIIERFLFPLTSASRHHMYAFCRIRAHCFGGGSYLVPPVLPVGAAWFIVVGSSLAYHCLFIVGVSSVYDWFTFGLLWFIIGSSLVVRINSASLVQARCSSLNQ